MDLGLQRAELESVELLMLSVPLTPDQRARHRWFCPRKGVCLLTVPATTSGPARSDLPVEADGEQIVVNAGTGMRVDRDGMRGGGAGSRAAGVHAALSARRHRQRVGRRCPHRWDSPVEARYGLSLVYAIDGICTARYPDQDASAPQGPGGTAKSNAERSYARSCLVSRQRRFAHEQGQKSGDGPPCPQVGSGAVGAAGMRLTPAPAMPPSS